MDKVYIIGCGGHARSVVDVLIGRCPDAEVVFVDERAKVNEKIFGFPVVKHASWDSQSKLFLCVGDNKDREKLFGSFESKTIVSIISHIASIGLESKIGRGVFIGNFAHIGPLTEIGDNTIINTGAIIEHEVKIGAHSHIAPNVAISGRSVIGDNVFVGVGATLINNISVCSDVMIGAGAVVVKSIIEPGVYVGCPAKKIK